MRTGLLGRVLSISGRAKKDGDKIVIQDGDAEVTGDLYVRKDGIVIFKRKGK